MRKLALTIGMLAAVAVASLAAAASPAAAASTVAWNATFSELTTTPSGIEHCAPGTSCGNGEVVGLGYAHDVIAFGGGCGGNCDLRTLTFRDGSTLVMAEQASNFRDSGRGVFTADLSDVIVAGTGRFAGASGSASGAVRGVVAGAAVITLSGTITF
jgi:hypothetical protein